MSKGLDLYLSSIVKRYDEDGIPYFSYTDFPNLTQTKFLLDLISGDKLACFIYNYNVYNNDKIIVFCHGLGGGHRSYLREIEYLCKSGYQVITYDVIGCFESTGNNIKGVTEFTNDLNSVLNYIQGHDIFGKRELIFVAHSCGAFAAGCCLSLHNEISKAVLISPFDRFIDGVNTVLDVSEEDLYDIVMYERSVNPLYSLLSVSSGIDSSNAKVLLIQSEDDSMVKINYGLNHIRNSIKRNDVEFIICNDKGHNPNYSLQAVKYMKEVFSVFNNECQLGNIITFEDIQGYFKNVDISKLTEQDPVIWERILNFINENGR